MEFHYWSTMADEYRRFHHKDRSVRKASDESIFQTEVQNILSSPFKNEMNRSKRLVRLCVEQSWMRSERPYYSVHPQMVRMLCKTNLDKIPAQFIELPHDFQAVCFRFAEDVPIRYSDGGVAVCNDERINESPIYARSVLFCRFPSDVLPDLRKWFPEAADEDQFVLCVDEGFRTKYGPHDRTLCNTIMLGAKPDESIPQAIVRAMEERAKGKDRAEWAVLASMHERLENLFRVIIASGFLANTPEDNLVVPDVLSKDRSTYEAAVQKGDEAAARQIVERARRRGKNGWNVGTAEIFVGERPLDSQPRSQGGGSQLQWSHLRAGHPHAVRFGEGKSKVKIKWYRPVRVRDDLPFKVEAET